MSQEACVPNNRRQKCYYTSCPIICLLSPFIHGTASLIGPCSKSNCVLSSYSLALLILFEHQLSEPLYSLPVSQPQGNVRWRPLQLSTQACHSCLVYSFSYSQYHVLAYSCVYYSAHHSLYTHPQQFLTSLEISGFYLIGFIHGSSAC